MGQPSQVMQQRGARIAGSLVVLLILGFFVCEKVNCWPPPPIPQPPPQPIINEIVPYPAEHFPPWVELHSPDPNSAVVLEGLSLYAGGAEAFPLPDQPPLEHDSPRVVCFADDDTEEYLNCPETEHLIHAPASLVASWNPGGGQLAVGRAPTGDSEGFSLVAFAAWGRPPTWELPDGRPAPSGWETAWIPLMTNAGVYDPATTLQRGHIIALRRGGNPGLPSDWSVMPPDGATEGQPNHTVGAVFMTPPDKTRVRFEDAVIVWMPTSGVEDYCIQFSLSTTFDDFLVGFRQFDIGGHYFRPSVAELNECSGADCWFFDRAYRYRILDMKCNEVSQTHSSMDRSITLVEVVIPEEIAGPGNLQYSFQRKDTQMLCMNLENQTDEGFPKYVGCNGPHWKLPHPPLVPPRSEVPDQSDARARQSRTASDWGIHADSYCVRASVSMIASAYGGNLSQDRISLAGKHPVVGNPDRSLHHTAPVFCDPETGGECTRLLAWALDASLPDDATLGEMNLEDSSIAYSSIAPEFSDISSYLTDNRPIMSRWHDGAEDHMRVIDACFETPDGDQWIHVLDPLAGGPQWWQIAPKTWSTAAVGTWICPSTSTGVDVRSDEAMLRENKDSDGDGILDFDEIMRFGTDPQKADTDGDEIPDGREVAGYVLHLGEYRWPVKAGATAADYDADERRKEDDVDNDNDGCHDGKEDTNKNGIMDENECNSFDPDDCLFNFCSCCNSGDRPEPPTP